MNLEQQFNFKDLEEVVLKTTSNIEIDGKTILANETIAAFDTLQLASFNLPTSMVTAHGGYLDADRVWWETPNELNFVLTNGVFSSKQFALMANSQLLTITEATPIYIDYTIEKESDENGQIEFTDDVYDYLFIYDVNTGERIDDFVRTIGVISNLEPYTNYLINYAKQYNSDCHFVEIGSPLIKGTLLLQGKTRVKDDITGRVRSGIITIPKLKLMTGLSMSLGKSAAPILGAVNARAYPVGEKGNTKIMEFAFLKDNIDSDL